MTDGNSTAGTGRHKTHAAGSKKPPAGFVVRFVGQATCIIRRDWEKELISSEVLTGNPAPARSGRAALSGGRGSASVHTVAGIGNVVLRRYRRGGLIGKILVDRYLSGTRPFRELAVLALAHSRDVPVPEVIGASSIRAGLFWHRGRIVTRLIEGSVTLPVFVGKNRGDTNRLAAILKRAGAAIRSMHDAGIDHADLNMNNILVDNKGAIFIIDFDKATAHREFGKRGRIRNLTRLLRSARKLAGLGLAFSDADFKTILAGFSGTDKQLLEKLKDSTTGSRRASLRGFLSRLIKRIL